MQRLIPISLAAGAVALALTPSLASASSKTFNFTGSFSDYGSLGSGEYALASKAAAEVCSYGNWSDSFKPFSYTLQTWLDGAIDEYSASNVSFSVTCTWQQLSYNFTGGWFSDEGSVQDGENDIENYYWKNTCGDSNHQLTNMHFNSFEYIVTSYLFGAFKTYAASNISGSFTCDT